MSAFIPPVATITSTTALQARKRVLSLYREWIRQAPEIVDIYRLEFSSKVVRQRIRQEFEKNRYVSDLHTIDILVFKGRTEFEETMNVWKQKTHVTHVSSRSCAGSTTTRTCMRHQGNKISCQSLSMDRADEKNKKINSIEFSTLTC